MEEDRQLTNLAVLVTVDLDSTNPSPDVAARATGVPTAAIDDGFGVLMLDARLHRHAVKVDAAAFRERRATGYSVDGPFSDPAIEHF